MDIKALGESVQWFLTLANTARDWKQIIHPKEKTTSDEKKTPGKTEPSEIPQQKPGAFGLSLEDERIFDGVLCQLDVKDQLLITDFLTKKCKNFQRNRFVQIVAGMEANPGVPVKHERVWDKKSGKPLVVSFPAIPGKDRRQEFLQKFAEILRDQSTASKAFDYLVGARTILKDSTSDMFKIEARKIRRERNARNELPKKKPYKGFWATATSFERNERRKP